MSGVLIPSAVVRSGCSGECRVRLPTSSLGTICSCAFARPKMDDPQVRVGPLKNGGSAGARSRAREIEDIQVPVRPPKMKDPDVCVRPPLHTSLLHPRGTHAERFGAKKPNGPRRIIRVFNLKMIRCLQTNSIKQASFKDSARSLKERRAEPCVT